MNTNPTLIEVSVAHGPARHPVSSANVPLFRISERLQDSTIGRINPNLKSAMCSTEKSMKKAANAVIRPIIPQKIHTQSIVQFFSLHSWRDGTGRVGGLFQMLGEEEEEGGGRRSGGRAKSVILPTITRRGAKYGALFLQERPLA